MTQTKAKKMLVDTWRFEWLDGAILLREVMLIEAVRTCENVLASGRPSHPSPSVICRVLSARDGA